MTFKPMYRCLWCNWQGTKYAIAFGNWALCPVCEKGDITWMRYYQGVLFE